MTQNSPTRTSVWVTTSFVGFHYWEQAPEEVAFLRNVHRHVFHVKATVDVSHSDRDVEFFILKRNLNIYCQKFEGTTFTYSCEQLAAFLGDWLQADNFVVRSVEVSEDGENGARVDYV